MNSVVPGAIVERRISAVARPQHGSRSSSAARIWRDVDLDVRERGRAERDHDVVGPAASGRPARSRSSRPPRARARAAPGCPSRERASARRGPIEHRGSWSTPITPSPRSAKDSASGRPTRPRPTTATLPDMRRSLTCGARRGTGGRPLHLPELGHHARRAHLARCPRAERRVRRDYGP